MYNKIITKNNHELLIYDHLYDLPLNGRPQKYFFYHTVISPWDRDQIGTKFGTQHVRSNKLTC